MRVDLTDERLILRSQERTWLSPEQYWGGMSAATETLAAPVVALQLDALRWNADDLVRRAGGVPIRIASKSLRTRSIIEAVLALPGFQGVLAYSLAEAVWLAHHIDDVVVAYPTADRHAIESLVTSPEASRAVTVMIDSVAQLELIDTVLPPGKRERVRVCIDFDASWLSPVLGRVGVYRSPVHEPDALLELAAHVVRRPGFTLVGLMSYEAQIAGVGNAQRAKPLRNALLRQVQQRSAAELSDRRAQAVALVRAVADLEFVNGGGTGSIEQTASESAITEVAAGSGLFGPHLFDHYHHFSPAPAAAFALDVVRNADERSATLLGGGWIASGVHGEDRLPQPVYPQGLRFAPREGAGEVQTPVLGQAASDLKPGDRVWLRHTKSGEIMEHANEIALVTGDELFEQVPTYRGEGKAFL